MLDLEHFRQRARALAEVGRFCFERGWLPATSGNLSARIDEERVAITVSGRHKGQLEEGDIMMVGLDGRILSVDRRPSAETELHLMLYRRDPSIGAVLHTHSVHATVLSRLVGDTLSLQDYEVMKAWTGVHSHRARIDLPVFENDQQIARLAERVEQRLRAQPGLPGYLIAGHGLYTWGEDVTEARRHIEAFEFLLECETLTRRMISR